MKGLDIVSNEPLAFDVKTLKQRLFVYEAKRWVSFSERGGDNKGQIVEAFQKAVDGRAVGEPWCLAFVQFCMKHVDDSMEEVLGKKTATHIVEKSEHCLTCFYKTPKYAHTDVAKPGRVVIWRHGNTTQGHAGIIVSVERDGEHMWTVEGNTSDPDSSVQREGDGVYLKRRNISGQGRMKVLGFLKPWV